MEYNKLLEIENQIKKDAINLLIGKSWPEDMDNFDEFVHNEWHVDFSPAREIYPLALDYCASKSLELKSIFVTTWDELQDEIKELQSDSF